MSLLSESKEFLEAIIPGTPEERVRTLMGETYNFDYHKAAEHLFKLLYPMGLVEEEGSPIDLEAMLARRASAPEAAGSAEESCPLLGKLCQAAERFDDMYGDVSTFIIGKLESGVRPEAPEWPILLLELKNRYSGERNDEVEILFVYHMVAEKGLSPLQARILAGFRS